MIGTLRFRHTVGYRPRSSQRITRTESRIPQRPDALPLPPDTNMHPQRMRVTSDARFTMPGNRSRICRRCCWSIGALPNSAQEMPQEVGRAKFGSVHGVSTVSFSAVQFVVF